MLVGLESVKRKQNSPVRSVVLPQSRPHDRKPRHRYSATKQKRMCPYILSKRDPLPKAQPQQHKKGIQTQHKIMDLNVEFCDETHVIEVALADTVEDMRRKVASAVGLREDSFDMSFGDKAMGGGADMTQLSAGDTIVVTTESKKLQAIAALRALGVTDLTARSLRSVEDPGVACLLLQAEVTTVIPDYFLCNSSLTRLDLSAVSAVTHVGDNFLFECESLTQLDLSSFNSLTHIDDYFACSCESLTAVDLSSLDSLTYVGECFLSDCQSLTQLDLCSLSRLEHIGDNFVSACEILTAVDLSSLNSLTHIGDGFLSGCSNLSSLNLSSLNSVTHVGQENFCQGTNLQTIRLSGCSAVVSSAVKKAILRGFVVEARPKRKRDESPDEDHKRRDCRSDRPRYSTRGICQVA